MSGQARPIDTIGRSGDLPLFFGLTYAITWALHGAIALFEFDNLFESGLPLLLYMLGLLGPLTAALILSHRRGGTGARTLLRQIFIVRFSPLLYLLAFGVIATVNYLALILNLARGGATPESWFALPWAFLPILALVQLWVVTGEETGWRGYALPRLQARYGSLGASIILGLLWTAWHLPMFLMPGAPQYGASPFVFAGFLVSWSVLCTLLYNRSGGSLLSVMLFHWAANMWAFAVPLTEGAQPIALALTLLVAVLAIPALPRPLFGNTSSTRGSGAAM